MSRGSFWNQINVHNVLIEDDPRLMCVFHPALHRPVRPETSYRDVNNPSLPIPFLRQCVPAVCLRGSSSGFEQSAILSRYFGQSEIYPVAMHFTKGFAANVPIDGWKYAEVCLAHPHGYRDHLRCSRSMMREEGRS